MTTTDGDGRPSFREVAEAMTPPGAKWDEWKAAMRQAHRPAVTSPDGWHRTSAWADLRLRC